VRLWQVEQFLDTGAEADTKPLAAAEGDQRMRQLVALAVGVRHGIHEAENALAPIGRGPDQHDEANSSTTNSTANSAR
jgi:hypothetical protein